MRSITAKGAVNVNSLGGVLVESPKTYIRRCLFWAYGEREQGRSLPALQFEDAEVVLVDIWQCQVPEFRLQPVRPQGDEVHGHSRLGQEEAAFFPCNSDFFVAVVNG